MTQDTDTRTDALLAEATFLDRINQVVERRLTRDEDAARRKARTRAARRTRVPLMLQALARVQPLMGELVPGTNLGYVGRIEGYWIGLGEDGELWQGKTGLWGWLRRHMGLMHRERVHVVTSEIDQVVERRFLGAMNTIGISLSELGTITDTTLVS